MPEWMINNLIHITLTSSLLVIIILMTKKLLGKKLSLKWNYYVWLLLIIKLIMPISFESSLSIYNIINYDSTEAVSYDISQSNIKENSTVYKEDSTQTNNKILESISPQMDNSIPISSILIGIWFIGFILIAGYYLVFKIKLELGLRKHKEYDDESMMTLLNRCKRLINVRRHVKIIVTEVIDMPSLYGIFFPRILIPKNIVSDKSEKEIEFLLMHELVHLKQRHHLWKALYLLLTALYWFNPFLWLGLKKMEQDGELLCDGEVIKYINRSDNIVYGNLIIDMASNHPMTVPLQAVSFNSNKKYLRNRIINITKGRKKSIRTKAASGLLTLFIALTLMTSAKANDDPLTHRIEQETGITFTEKIDEMINTLNENKDGYVSIAKAKNELILTYEYDREKAMKDVGNTVDLFSIRIKSSEDIPEMAVIYIEQLDTYDDIFSTHKDYMPIFNEVIGTLFENEKLVEYIIEKYPNKVVQSSEEMVIDNYRVRYIMDGKHKFYVYWE